jgi:hypothetical protein
MAEINLLAVDANDCLVGPFFVAETWLAVDEAWHFSRLSGCQADISPLALSVFEPLCPPWTGT